LEAEANILNVVVNILKAAANILKPVVNILKTGSNIFSGFSNHYQLLFREIELRICLQLPIV